MAGFLGSILQGVGAVFGIRAGLEEPQYDVLGRAGGGIAIRRYGPRVAAETDLPPAEEPERAQAAAFRTLFRYISGANAPAERLGRTAPVATGRGTRIAMTAPVAQGDDGRGTMRFFLPATFTPETAPRPTDPAVRIVAVPEETVAVLRFTGRAGAYELGERRSQLLGALHASGWTPIGAAETWFYDPPFTIPWLRRNEIAMRVDRR